MFRKINFALAAILVLGSASLALADDYTDLVSDGIHPVIAQPVQTLTSKPVGLTNTPVTGDIWMEHASQNVGGGY